MSGFDESYYRDWWDDFNSIVEAESFSERHQGSIVDGINGVSGSSLHLNAPTCVNGATVWVPSVEQMQSASYPFGSGILESIPPIMEQLAKENVPPAAAIPGQDMTVAHAPKTNGPMWQKHTANFRRYRRNGGTVLQCTFCQKEYKFGRCLQKHLQKCAQEHHRIQQTKGGNGSLQEHLQSTGASPNAESQLSRMLSPSQIDYIISIIERG